MAVKKETTTTVDERLHQIAKHALAFKVREGGFASDARFEERMKQGGLWDLFDKEPEEDVTYVTVSISVPLRIHGTTANAVQRHQRSKGTAYDESDRLSQLYRGYSITTPDGWQETVSGLVVPWVVATLTESGLTPDEGSDGFSAEIGFDLTSPDGYGSLHAFNVNSSGMGTAHTGGGYHVKPVPVPSENGDGS